MGILGVILMGGQSSRFGSPKAEFIWRGKALVQHMIELLNPFCTQTVLVGQKHQHYPSWGQSSVLNDTCDYPMGPLRGIECALAAYPTSPILVVPCDAPWIHPALLQILVQASDQTTCFAHEDRLMPFPSLWTQNALQPVRRCLEQGIQSPRATLNQIQARVLVPAIWTPHDPHALSFKSANTPQELL